jgi:hypothetical protein
MQSGGYPQGKAGNISIFAAKHSLAAGQRFARGAARKDGGPANHSA